MEPDTEVARIATRVARKWSQRVPCDIALEDLSQEAHVAILLAKRSYDPDKGAFVNYAHRAAIRWLRGFVGHAMAPVSGPQNAQALWLLRFFAAEKCAEFDAYPSTCEHPDASVWRAEVREAFTQVVGSVSDAETVFNILSGESKAAFEAERTGVPVREIYDMTARARRRLEESQTMWKLWKESET